MFDLYDANFKVYLIEYILKLIFIYYWRIIFFSPVIRIFYIIIWSVKSLLDNHLNNLLFTWIVGKLLTIIWNNKKFTVRVWPFCLIIMLEIKIVFSLIEHILTHICWLLKYHNISHQLIESLILLSDLLNHLIRTDKIIHYSLESLEHCWLLLWIKNFHAKIILFLFDHYVANKNQFCSHSTHF